MGDGELTIRDNLGRPVLPRQMLGTPTGRWGTKGPLSRGILSLLPKSTAKQLRSLVETPPEGRISDRDAILSLAATSQVEIGDVAAAIGALKMMSDRAHTDRLIVELLDAIPDDEGSLEGAAKSAVALTSGVANPLLRTLLLTDLAGSEGLPRKIVEDGMPPLSSASILKGVVEAARPETSEPVAKPSGRGVESPSAVGRWAWAASLVAKLAALGSLTMILITPILQACANVLKVRIGRALPSGDLKDEMVGEPACDVHAAVVVAGGDAQAAGAVVLTPSIPVDSMAGQPAVVAPKRRRRNRRRDDARAEVAPIAG